MNAVAQDSITLEPMSKLMLLSISSTIDVNSVEGVVSAGQIVDRFNII